MPPSCGDPSASDKPVTVKNSDVVNEPAVEIVNLVMNQLNVDSIITLDCCSCLIFEPQVCFGWTGWKPHVASSEQTYEAHISLVCL